MTISEVSDKRFIQWSENWTQFGMDMIVNIDKSEYSISIEGQSICKFDYDVGDQYTPATFERHSEQIEWNATVYDESGPIALELNHDFIESAIYQHLN